MFDAVHDLITSRGRGLKNYWVPKTSKKIVIFESDDWGSERIPSREVAQLLQDAGLIDLNNPYSADSLESAQDLYALYETLSGFRDTAGRHPVFSCYANPANPDYLKIAAHDFQLYFSESVSQTLQRRGDLTETKTAWQQGVADGFLSPQFHGREHLQAQHWLQWVKTLPQARRAFDLGFYSIAVPGSPNSSTGLRAAFYCRNLDEMPTLAMALMDGARLFEQEYGLRASVICPPNNIFHPDLYVVVKAAGFDAIVRHTRNFQSNGRGGLLNAWGRHGVAPAGLQCFGRNVLFEPTQGFGVEHALKGIHSAFAWRVPAFISTHRVNYIGRIKPVNRDNGLSALRDLLTRVQRLWPDVCFMSSDDWVKSQHD